MAGKDKAGTPAGRETGIAFIEPLEDKVLVLPDEPPSKIGSIHLPDSAKEKPSRGRVVAVGPGRWNAAGVARVPMHLKPGDAVVYAKYEGTKVEHAGIDYVLLKEDSVLGREVL